MVKNRNKKKGQSMRKSKSIVQSKGQVTLPTEIRRELGIKPGDSVVFELTGQGVLVKAEKVERLERFNQLLVEMNQLLQEEESERGQSFSLEEMIEGVREERGKILKAKYGLNAQND
jgi:AbrB family looped-hinge helix DNA binding protein